MPIPRRQQPTNRMYFLSADSNESLWAQQNHEEEDKHAYPSLEEEIKEEAAHPYSQPYPAFSLDNRLNVVWPQQQQQDDLKDDKHDDPEAPFSDEVEAHPYRSPNYPQLSINNSRDVVLSRGQVMPRLTPQPNNERSALSLKLEAYYGSPPQEISEIKGEEKAFSVTFSMENAGPKLTQYPMVANNCVHFKITSNEMAQIDIKNATTHYTLLTKLKNYVRQLDGADDSRVTAFFRSRTFNSASPKRIRIEVLRNMLMNGLPENFDTTPTRQEHYPIINRNINQFQKALDENDNVLFGAPREPVALNYTKQAVSFVSCGRYQPSPSQGQELMEDINRLVKTNMRI